jgi:urease accessory protein
VKLGDGGTLGVRPLPHAQADFGGWRARLALEVDLAASGASRLRRSLHEGPLRVQRPFYPEGALGPCHIYVLHPPGGVVDGDSLALDVHVAHGAAALLTTPGASKLYRARDDSALMESCAHSNPALSSPRERITVLQKFTSDRGAVLEWLPHETIAFDGARASVKTVVELHEQATYAGWELICLGRPACGELFTRGELRTELSISRGGRLSYLERGLYRGGHALLQARWGLSGFPVIGTFVLAAPGARASWVESVREQVVCEEGLLAVTLVSGVLVLRFVGASTRAGRLLFERALAVLRPLYAGRAAVHPRIWST